MVLVSFLSAVTLGSGEIRARVCSANSELPGAES
jgi:hypothetical protein